MITSARLCRFHYTLRLKELSLDSLIVNTLQIDRRSGRFIYVTGCPLTLNKCRVASPLLLSPLLFLLCVFLILYFLFFLELL